MGLNLNLTTFLLLPIFAEETILPDVMTLPGGKLGTLGHEQIIASNARNDMID